MQMYRKGQKVRMTIDCGGGGFKIGDVFTLTDDGERAYFVDNDGDRRSRDRGFELVEQPWQPKVGDRVRLVKDGKSTTGAVGKTATLVAWDSGQFIDNDEYLLDIDPPLDYQTLAVTPNYTRAKIDCFEPLPVAEQPAALKIEAGKFYRTRDGRKVGPMVAFYDDGRCFASSGTMKGGLWNPDGSAWFTGAEDSPVLIAEWVDEPAAAPATPVAATASNDNAPVALAKFKVGDVVVATRDYADVTKGNRYTIIEVDADDEELPIRVKDDAGDGWWLDHDAFEIITPAAPASTTGFTIPLVEDEPEPLTVTLSLDADDFHDELDEIIAKLKKIRKLQRQIAA